ncbi:MAG: hypothetical protein ACJAYR_003270 [Sneathiella sp.]|jgi:hypothetical protein
MQDSSSQDKQRKQFPSGNPEENKTLDSTALFSKNSSDLSKTFRQKQNDQTLILKHMNENFENFERRLMDTLIEELSKISTASSQKRPPFYDQQTPIVVSSPFKPISILLCLILIGVLSSGFWVVHRTTSAIVENNNRLSQQISEIATIQELTGILSSLSQLQMTTVEDKIWIQVEEHQRGKILQERSGHWIQLKGQ